jgi:CDP-diacylglycerol--glycerol-3-phosphate 3-phosphatidyltransferase
VIDLVAGIAVAAAGLGIAVVWATSSRARSARVERVERGGSSPLLGDGVQRVAYRGLERLGHGLAQVGLGADAITLASIPFALAAGAAFATEHYGLGALLAGASYACDALDGVVARATGTASSAGEVLDSICDRLCEAFIMGGLAVGWRGSAPLLALVLLAELGACQVTLASAKAETFPRARGHVPRGLMRRAERAVYLVGAAAAAGVLQEVVPASASLDARLPLVVALSLIALLGNASAVSRFLSLARALRSNEVPDAGE